MASVSTEVHDRLIRPVPSCWGCSLSLITPSSPPTPPPVVVRGGLPPAELAELEALVDADGRLHVEDVITAAEDPASALHHHFTWDQAEGHRQWLLHQGR